jgi:hypothetical protein
MSALIEDLQMRVARFRLGEGFDETREHEVPEGMEIRVGRDVVTAV